MRLNRLLTSVCWELSHWITVARGDESVITVCEYPKAGGTWVAKSIAAAADLPYVGSGFFLPLIPAVVRTHWPPSRRLAPCVFVVRDVRDVMVSLFHHRCRNMQRTPQRAKQFQKLFGEELSVDKIVQQLPGFIEIEFSDPRYGANMNWSQYTEYVTSLINSPEKGKVALVRYEEMLTDPVSVLEKTLDILSIEVPRDYVALAVQLNDRKWGTKNFAGIESVTTFFRNGKSGDWRDVFSRSAGEKIASLCGDQLIELGYEMNRTWWMDLPEQECLVSAGNRSEAPKMY